MAYDISILGDVEDGPSLLDFDGKVVNGGQKLVQQVLILLFTDEDEPLSFDIGTQIPGYLAGANVYDEASLTNQFSIAASKVADTLRKTQSLNLPDDEKLQRIDVTVTRSTTAKDQAEVTITVVSQDDTVTAVRVPIELNQVPGYGGNS